MLITRSLSLMKRENKIFRFFSVQNSRFTNIISFNGVFEASFHAGICAIKNTFMHFVTLWKMSKNGIHNIAQFMVLYHYMKTIWEIKIFFIQRVYEIIIPTFQKYDYIDFSQNYLLTIAYLLHKQSIYRKFMAL